MPDRRHFLAVSLYGLFGSLVTLFPLPPRVADAATTLPDFKNPGEPEGHILVIGDSLAAEYGLPQGSGWVALIAKRLNAESRGYQIHNSSVSGDTTSGGLSRLPAELERVRPDIVIIELGANDALRGLSLDVARDNLARMLHLIQDQGAQVLLAGMQIPPNYGPRYAKQFASLFPELANTYQTALIPFLLDGFADQANMFLEDGIHPNQAAQPIIAETVWGHLAPLLVPNPQ